MASAPASSRRAKTVRSGRTHLRRGGSGSRRRFESGGASSAGAWQQGAAGTAQQAERWLKEASPELEQLLDFGFGRVHQQVDQLACERRRHGQQGGYR